MSHTSEVRKPHAVCMPIPAQGHIKAMLKLAKLLYLKGFHITFVHNESNYNQILTSSGPIALQGLKDFRFETIPDSIPTDQEGGASSFFAAVRHNYADPFRNLLKRLNGPSSGVPPVTCILSDSFTSFTLGIAAELGIPDVFFCSVSAFSYMGMIHYEELVQRGLVPLKSESDISNGYLDTPIDWIPGMENVSLKDLPAFLRTSNPNDVFFNFIKDEAQAAFRATAIIINTFDELEVPVLEAMSTILPPIYTTGPLTLLYRQVPDNSLESLGSSLWKENHDCLKWLEDRAAGSVIYMNFGSGSIMANEQVVEFAWGLANSGYDFLWVIRPGIVNGGLAILPKEFLDEIDGRGFLTSWCPQEEVLMHPSVGGFLTHCGWNSTMESISVGMPMICYPCFGDQQTNCRNLCIDWGIALEISNNVKRDDVVKHIRELMGGEKGKDMRRKALKLKDSAIKATEQGGSSFLNLERVINEVLLKGKNFT